MIGGKKHQKYEQGKEEEKNERRWTRGLLRGKEEDKKGRGGDKKHAWEHVWARGCCCHGDHAGVEARQLIAAAVPALYFLGLNAAPADFSRNGPIWTKTDAYDEDENTLSEPTWIHEWAELQTHAPNARGISVPAWRDEGHPEHVKQKKNAET